MPVAQRRELILERLHRPGEVGVADLAGNLPVSDLPMRGDPEAGREPCRVRGMRERADSTAPDLIAPPSRRDALVTDSGTEQKVRETPAAHVGRPVVADVRGGRG